MTVQLRPLRRWRRSVYDHNGSSIRRQVQYGNGLYITNGSEFFIINNEGVWKISPNNVAVSIAVQIEKTGLFDTDFPRQADAIEALQVTLETVDEVNE